MKKYLGIAILSTMIACTNPAHKGEGATDSTSSTENKDASVKVELADPKIEKIYASYITVKNELVAANAKATQGAAAELSTALKAFEGCENTALISDKIAGTADIKVQRKEFTALSSDVIALFKHAEVKTGAIYVQHCPMANNGDGGDWLSSDKKIRNPYYGDEMLECGAVLEELTAKK